MSKPVLNLGNSLCASSILTRAIASSLLLIPLGTLGYSVSAQPLNPQLVAQQTTPANTNTVVQRLSGSWQTKVSSTQALSLIFAPDGKLFIVLPSSSANPPAMQLRYRVASASSSPMQIDLTTSDNKTAQTIFELTKDGKLRVQLNDISAAQPRPSAFKPSAMLFEKVSNSTTLPANARITGSGIPQRR